jgi:putative glutathione S-transferase
LIVRALKGLEDVIQLIEVDDLEEGKGWKFTGTTGPDQDPLYGYKYLRQLYEKASSDFTGRVTVPVLWDKTTGIEQPLLLNVSLTYSRNYCEQ